MGCIYSISCPINKQIVYIGQTSQSFECRMIAHYRHPSNSGLKIFMDDLKSKGLYPVCNIVEDDVVERNLFIREKFWIAHHIEKGIVLFNKKMGKPSKHDFKLITDFSQTVLVTRIS